MFGLKIFNKSKSKKFKNDKERKRYYAIQNYYKNKAERENDIKSAQKTKATKKR